MNTTRHLLLGLLFLSSIGILAAYTLLGTDFDPFGKAKELNVLFPEAKNLREGDSVLVAGMRVGSVKSMAFQLDADIEDRIEVVLKIELPIVLHEGYAIFIEDATLLGGRNVLIEPGDPELPVLASDFQLRGVLASNPLESLEELGLVVSENRDAVKGILDNLNTIVADVEIGRGTVGMLLRDEALAEDLQASLADLRTSMSNVSAISADLRSGQGLISRLVSDPTLADDFSKILLDVSEVVGGLSGGEGLLGRILSPNDPMADEFSQLVTNLQEIVAKVNAGTGTLGNLINDDAIARDLSRILSDLAEGRGSLGALLSSDELYQGFLRLTENLSDVSGALREGRGTLGKLIMEPELYDELLSTVGVLNRSLEDFREAAPVSTFTSVLFGAF